MAATAVLAAATSCASPPDPIVCQTIFEPDFFSTDPDAQQYLALLIPIGASESCVDQVMSSADMMLMEDDRTPAGFRVYREKRYHGTPGAGPLNSRVVIVELHDDRVTALRVN